MILALVAVVDVEAVEVAGQVIGGAGVEIPVGVAGVA
jgi:hypothetical protein